MTLEEASQLLSNWITQNPTELAAQKAAVEQYGMLFRPETSTLARKRNSKRFCCSRTTSIGLEYTGKRISTLIWTV
jgi:hypothetical protein